MVAAKSVVGPRVLALLSAGAALADRPDRQDQGPPTRRRPQAALLRQSDFGAGWRGGKTADDRPDGPVLPGFDPKESDLVVSGHAQAGFTFSRSIVQFEQAVVVLRSPAAVREDFARTIRPGLSACIAYNLRKAKNVAAATVTRLPFPHTGSNSAAYRAVVVVRGAKGTGRVMSDLVFFSQGRLEYTFNVVAPVGAGEQLTRFEAAMAQLLLKRVSARGA